MALTRKVFTFDVVDIHIGGDVHRIVLDGVDDPPGASVLEKTRYLEREADGLRQVLLGEPRGGHPALFADLVVCPCAPEADAGMIIMENNGYPMFSGTNIMSTAMALVESGRVRGGNGALAVRLEAPGGLVDVNVECRDSRVTRVRSVPSKPVFRYEAGLAVDVPGRGPVPFDLFWAGEFFPVIDAAGCGFALESGEERALGAFARSFVEAARCAVHPVHPEIDDRRALASAIFTGPLETGPDGCPERRVVPYVYPNHEVGRCPAGMPSSVAIAELCLRGEWERNEVLRTRSPSGASLEVEVVGTASTGGFDGFRVAVSGRGWTIARSEVVVDTSDPMTPGDGFEKLLNRVVHE